MKVRSALFFTIVGVFVVMLFFNGFLFIQNKEYKTLNRELIIQNDSILSANIELMKAFEKQRNLSNNLTLSKN